MAFPDFYEWSKLKDSTLRGDIRSARKLVNLYESEQMYESPRFTKAFNGYKILHHAIKYNHRNIFTLLLSSERFVQSTDICGENQQGILPLLQIAVENNDNDLVDMLLNEAPDLYFNEHGAELVYHAIKNEYIEMFETFMKYFSNFTALVDNNQVKGTIAYCVFKSENIQLIHLCENCDFADESVLYWAIYNNDFKSVKKLLDMGVDIHRVKSIELTNLGRWYTLLYTAITSNDDEMIKTLSECEDIDFSYEDIVGKNLLILAYENRNLGMLRVLFRDTQINLNDVSGNEHSLLHLAVQNDDLDVCRLILEDYSLTQSNGKYIDYRIFGNFICNEKEIKQSAFQLAKEKNNEEIIKLFVKNKKRIDSIMETRVADLYRTFYQAIINKDDKLIKDTLSKCDEIELNYEDVVGKKPLLVAYESKNLELIEIFLKDRREDLRDLYPNASGGKSSLIHLAAEDDELEICKLLVNNFPYSDDHEMYKRVRIIDFRTTLAAWCDLLHLAITKNNETLIKEIIKLDEINLNYEDIVGKKPLLVAYESRNSTMLEQFVEVDPTSVNDLFLDEEGNEHTLLYSAIQNGDLQACELLLKTPNDIKPQGAEQLTPLHLAINKENDIVVALILQQFMRDHIRRRLLRHNRTIDDYAEVIDSTFELALQKNNAKIINSFVEITIFRLKLMSNDKKVETVPRRYSDETFVQFFHKFILPLQLITDESYKYREENGFITSLFILSAIKCGFKNSTEVAFKHGSDIYDKKLYETCLFQAIKFNHADILIYFLLHGTLYKDLPVVNFAIGEKSYQCLSILLDFDFKYISTSSTQTSKKSKSKVNGSDLLIREIFFKCPKRFNHINFDEVEDIFLKFILKRHLAKLPVVDETVYEKVRAHPKADSIIRELEKEIDSMGSHRIEDTSITFKDIFMSLSNKRLPSKYLKNSAIMKTFESQDWFDYYPNYCYIINYFVGKKIWPQKKIKRSVIIDRVKQWIFCIILLFLYFSIY